MGHHSGGLFAITLKIDKDGNLICLPQKNLKSETVTQ
jgi:hypothetical protein